MGLDMYLWKAKTPRDMGGENPRTLKEMREFSYDGGGETAETRFTSKYESVLKEKSKLLDDLLNGNLFVKGTSFHYISPFQDVGYWRKANQIHKWFVDNVQNGEDDCGVYPVTFDQLTALLSLCQLVVETAKIEKGMIENGQQMKDGKWVSCMVDGETITNPEEVAKLLPTEEGFFFGGTGYDEYYMSDVKNTIEIISKIHTPDSWDEKGMTYFYSSSW